jgi:uronate dehydrogenase
LIEGVFMKKVLITGMSGIIGSDLRRHLEDVGGYELSALNRSPVEGVKWFQADIADLKEVEKACVGQDTVVHLSAHLPDGEDGDIWEGNLSSNIIGTYNIYEAARRTGVKRVIFASSGAVMQGMQTSPQNSQNSQKVSVIPVGYMVRQKFGEKH